RRRSIRFRRRGDRRQRSAGTLPPAQQGLILPLSERPCRRPECKRRSPGLHSPFALLDELLPPCAICCLPCCCCAAWPRPNYQEPTGATRRRPRACTPSRIRPPPAPTDPTVSAPSTA